MGEDEGRVVTLLQYAWRSSGATAASRQEDFSECNWKDLTLTRPTNGYCPPVHALMHTLLLIGASQRGQSGPTRVLGGGGSWGFCIFLQALGQVSEIPPEGAARITEVPETKFHGC